MYLWLLRSKVKVYHLSQKLVRVIRYCWSSGHFKWFLRGRSVTGKLVPPKIGPGGPILPLNLVPPDQFALEKFGPAVEYWSALDLLGNWPKHGSLGGQFEQRLSNLLGNLLHADCSLLLGLQGHTNYVNLPHRSFQSH